MNRFEGSNKDTYRIKRPEDYSIFPKEVITYDCNQYPVRKLIAVGDKIEDVVPEVEKLNPIPKIEQTIAIPPSFSNI